MRLWETSTAWYHSQLWLWRLANNGQKDVQRNAKKTGNETKLFLSFNTKVSNLPLFALSQFESRTFRFNGSRNAVKVHLHLGLEAHFVIFVSTFHAWRNSWADQQCRYFLTTPMNFSIESEIRRHFRKCLNTWWLNVECLCGSISWFCSDNDWSL